jgi:uncharacterized membrane protein YhaH (DUF805 family)
MATNPYAAPQADVRDIAQAHDYQEVRILSPRGRIGRLRYLAWSFGFQLLILVPVMILGAVVPGLEYVLTGLAYLAVLAFTIILGIQRSHDMDWSGWTVLLALIPLVALIWVFKAGTDGPNRFGNPPPPNTTAIKVLGIGLPVFVIVLGVVAAIAIPAYADYVQRTQGFQ